MTDINLDDYYSAGYFVIRKTRRPSWLDDPHGLVPEMLISLETEFCPKFNVGWGWSTEYRARALDFGVDESKWDEFSKWCVRHNDVGVEVWSMFPSTNVVRTFIQKFIPTSKRAELVIVGAGIHQSCEQNWRETHGTEGVEQRILKHLRMEQGGVTLGFEVASYEHHDFDHSWFSHGHHRDIFEQHSIRPGPFGLIQSREEAIVVSNHATENDNYDYEYWLMAEYLHEV